ncbi:lipopolysaccharide biosynthesis protein [Microbacterium sp. XT11]|uniref:lipopolysaccharide biosynthesis protein n=1 Tax=Microbacterium sp. XT11 TaxID=367477 RepID=UPI000742F4DD|nr:lipopolysaccharide biosynthesis protein [Microbacterium sp. XT11]ALX66286.1 Putative membrane protein [Microbacterium sp. XT11]
MVSSLAHSAARGAYFTLAAQAARIVLQLLSVVILARILSPHDYGLLAIVLVVVGLGEIFRDFGLTSASIQAPELSAGQRDNLFWINAGMGVVLTAVMFSLSWAIGAVTGKPELVGISQWLSLSFLLNGLATQHRANLMRDLKLRPLAVIDVASSAIALAVAIAVAIAGAGYWALVVQQLVTSIVVLAGVVIAGRWVPRLYSRSHPVAQMVNFGWTLVATNLIGYASRQIDTVLISFRFGTVPLGLYNRAFQLIMTPLAQVRSPLQSVALPVLSRVQQDQPRFENYVTAAQLALGFLFGIPVAIVAGLAEPVVDIMLGSRWAEAAPMLRMFAIAGILTTVSFVGYWVYLARGLGAELLRYTIVTALLKVVCIVIGSFFGILGVAVAFAVHPALAWPISLSWLSRITPMPRRQLYQGACRIIAVSLAAGLAAWGAGLIVAGTSSWLQLAAGLVAGLAVSACALVVPAYRRDAKTLSAFVRLMLTREGRAS